MAKIRIEDIEPIGMQKSQINFSGLKDLPWVSCIMPTSDRRAFTSKAVEYFLRQDYPKRELVVVDDGEDSVRDLVPGDSHIRYIYLNQKTPVGAKRNLACEEAKGNIILHWDDDDWMARQRISYQVRALIKEQADICGLNRVIFYNPLNSQSWLYIYQERGKPWVYGGTLCYTKKYWGKHPFPEINVGEDNYFVWSSPLRKVTILHDPTFYISLIHPGNTSPKRTTDIQWHSYPTAKVRALIGQDCTFYDHLKL